MEFHFHIISTVMSFTQMSMWPLIFIFLVSKLWHLPSDCTEIFFFFSLDQIHVTGANISLFPLYVNNTICICLFKYHHSYCTAIEPITMVISHLLNVRMDDAFCLKLPSFLSLDVECLSSLKLIAISFSVLIKSRFCFDCWLQTFHFKLRL